MRETFGVAVDDDHLGNAEALSAVWPKDEAPIMRLGANGQRELVRMRWGFLTPKVSKKTGKPLQPAVWNNARSENLGASLWRDSFIHRRCLIPATSFREAKGRNPATDVWFALKGKEPRPLFAFAGIWREEQTGIEGEPGTWRTHTMLTTGANELVKSVHPTRMPVILPSEAYESWLTAPPREALRLLQPYPGEQMQIVLEGVGVREDVLASP